MPEASQQYEWPNQFRCVAPPLGRLYEAMSEQLSSFVDTYDLSPVHRAAEDMAGRESVTKTPKAKPPQANVMARSPQPTLELIHRGIEIEEQPPATLL